MQNFQIKDSRKIASNMLSRLSVSDQSLPVQKKTPLFFHSDQYLHYMSAKKYGLRLSSLTSKDCSTFKNKKKGGSDENAIKF